MHGEIRVSHVPPEALAGACVFWRTRSLPKCELRTYLSKRCQLDLCRHSNPGARRPARRWSSPPQLVPTCVTFRIVWFKMSATYVLPTESKAIPPGELKRAVERTILRCRLI